MDKKLYDKLYKTSLEADDAFEAEIQRQFEGKKGRFDVSPSSFDAETLKAFHVKLAADKAWIYEFNKKNKEN